jgi:hypothetical protein
MGILGFGKAAEKRLVVVSYEGGGRLRLNGIRVRNRKTKDNAAGHSQTVCWVEFEPDGARSDLGKGPEAARLPADKLDRLIQELPQTPECRAVLKGLADGQERVGQWLNWGGAGAAKRGTAGDQGRS